MLRYSAFINGFYAYRRNTATPHAQTAISREKR